MLSKVPVTWDIIDAFEVPEHFSRFPAGIAHNAGEVVDALQKVIALSCAPGSKEGKKAFVRHMESNNEPFAICHCTAIPERLVVLSAVIELAWIHDDITEEMSHKDACTRHDVLMRAMDLRHLIDSDIGQFSTRETMFGLIVQKGVSIDPKAAPKMLEVLSNYLLTFDNSDEDFLTIEKYNPYRVANCGYWISSYFIRWGMGLTLTDAEYETIREFDFSMGIILGLTNDYFSWEVEKDQQTDRMRNAVGILKRQYNVEERVAKTLLRGIIVDEEEKACRLKLQALEGSPTPGVVQYIDAIELYVGGSCYWHATAPRYKRDYA